MDADEDRDAAVIRTLLSGVEPPPGRIAATDLLANGRRARRRRRSAAAVAGVFVLTAAVLGGVGVLDRARTPAAPAASRDASVVPTAPESAAPVPCAVAAMRLPSKATSAEVNGGSPSGRYAAGFSSVGEALATPVRWDGTTAQPIGVAGPAEAQDVNDSGVVVGKAQAANGRSFAWAYADGRVTRLPVPAGYTGAEANAINNRGDVAGVLFGGSRTAAAVWRGAGPNARVEILAATGGAMAFGISDSGVVVGTRDGDGESQAYRWDAQGRGQRLASSAGYVGGGVDGVRGDWAYGRLRLAAPAEHPASATGRNAVPGAVPGAKPPLGQGPTGVNPNVGVLFNLRTQQLAVLADGDVGAAGSGGASVVNGTGHRAWLRGPDGALRQLPGLTAEATTYAYAVSDDGTLAAGVSAHRPVLWNCSERGTR